MSEIDVSKCEFYCEKYDGCYCFNSSNEVYAVNPNEHNSCEANKDCYYKQLQQLKTENEELRYLVFSWEEINTLQEKYINALDEIEEYCKTIKKDHYWGMREVNFAQQVLRKIKEVRGK